MWLQNIYMTIHYSQLEKIYPATIPSKTPNSPGRKSDFDLLWLQIWNNAQSLKNKSILMIRKKQTNSSI